MNAQPTQPTQKVLEYQEAGLALRAAEQARRTVITFFGAPVLAIFGIFFAKNTTVFAFFYLSIVGLLVVVASFLLFRQNNKTIKDTRDRLCALQCKVTANVYSDSIDTGRWERRFYILLHSLAGVAFVILLIYSSYGVSGCNYFPWQGCGFFRSTCPSLAECPCGILGAQLTVVAEACPIDSPLSAPPPK